MPLKVSILIPAYNAQDWIPETIESALSQDWPNKEIIIVDDGSTDRTLAVAKGFESKGVKVVSQGNAGASTARNHAFSLAQGDYIQWLDADDVLGHGKISAQMEAVKGLTNRNTLLSCRWGRFMYRVPKARFVRTALWCDLSQIEWVQRQMEQNIFIQPAAWLVSRELTLLAGEWDTRLSNNDDGEYFCRVVLASDGVKFVEGAEAFYRTLAANSLSRLGKSRKKLDSLFLSVKLNIAHLLEREKSERTRNACLKYLSDVLIFFYPEQSEILEEAGKLAESLGGVLPTPRLPLKYALVQKTLGWTAAKWAQDRYNRYKWALIRNWEYALCRIQKKDARSAGLS